MLLSRIHAKRACVGIIGLGYVGLPLARAFAGKGFPVLGFDIDPERRIDTLTELADMLSLMKARAKIAERKR